MVSIPGNITEQHFLQALAEIDQEGVPPEAESSTYDLVHNGQTYPPIYVLSLASKHANGRELDRTGLGEGLGTTCFKKILGCGFDIRQKEPAVDNNSGNAVLLTWNPKNHEIGGDGTSDYTLDLSPGKLHSWRCRLKDANTGDRVYLLRLGVPPKGLIARGVVVNPPYEGENWKDPEKSQTSIDFEIEEFRPGCADGLLPTLLLQQVMPSQNWSPQGSGIRLGNLDEIEKHWQANEGQHSVTALLEYVYRSKDKQEWHDRYTAMVTDCHPVLSDPAELTDELLERLWLEADNGISSVLPGTMLQSDFKAHKGILRDITGQIAAEPSQKTLDHILDSWKSRGFKKIYNAVPHRVFSTFYSDKFTSFVSLPKLKEVSDYLREHLEIDIPNEEGWCDLNRELLEAVGRHTSDSSIIGANDPIAKNIAIWNLYELIKSKQGTKDKDEKAVAEDPPQVSVSKSPNLPQSNLNTILYGPPGTGKTYDTVQKAVEIIERQSAGKSREDIKHRYDQLVEDGRIAFVTFHQSFSYEDFVEGIRASTVDGQITYAVEPGIFKQIADRARQSGKETPHVLIIDEVNRGNASSIFGELITLLEPEKRLGAEDSRTLTLPYSKEPFGVPDNLYIIGTMNTADRSLTLLDTALRRRFEFEEMEPDSKLLPKSIEGIDLRLMLDTINDRIEAVYDREHRLGHAYFLGLKNKPEIAELSRIFDRHIIPLLQEYFFEDWKNIRIVLGDDRKTAAHQILVEKPYPEESFSEANARFKNNTRYVIDTEALKRPATYIGIYKPEE